MSATCCEPCKDDTARNMADALTYLGRVARDAGYHAIVADILAIRDKMNCIASAEEADRAKEASA
ncbi:hypothetical protein XH99_14100 [Bradyrhizobium nanningense]|uniref:Uncharacterized protein n=1 Tax=Bradyrhizobium nanningense TaxID=1325118 RepID=A0A4Q0S6Y9_9BRAD|nr:hypothetical protein XH99_14100 [Bradyrhizobium nanningense]